MKIISPLVSDSVGRSLSADPNFMDLLQAEQPEICALSDPVDLSVGDIRLQIAAEQIARRSQWRAYRKPKSIFLMVPSLTPYDLPFPQNGGFICPKIREWAYFATSDPILFMIGSRVGF